MSNSSNETNDATSANSESYDFSSETSKVGSDRIELIPHDPKKHQDEARKTIAIWLLSLLWFVIFAIFLLAYLGKISVSDIKEFSVLLGPIVALVSAATGFYYGAHSAEYPERK